MRLSDYVKYRILEIIPGSAIWLTFIGIILLIFIKPLWAVYFIVVFDLYWLIRVVYLIIYIILSFRNFRRDSKINWRQKIENIKGYEKIYHLIFMPTYKEPLEVLRMSFQSLADVDYPRERILVVFCIEERDREEALKNAEILKREFSDKFLRFIVSLHPKDLPGEVPGKGSNTAWGGHIAQKVVDEIGIPYENIIVSSFDVDSCAHRQYFSYVTYHYLTTPNPTHYSYQPVPLFNNNIWNVPAIMRVVSNSTTFWLMSEQLRPERLFTFSSHSMSFRTLVDVGFWQNDIVTEDSRIFLQGLLHYDGDYRVKSLHLPISMDAVAGKNIWKGFENLYKQQRRWAWGVEHFPYLIWNYSKNKKIPFLTKFRYLWNLTEGMYSWATAPVIIFVLGYLPLRLSSIEVQTSIIGQNAPQVLKYLMGGAMVGLFVSAALSVYFLPHKGIKMRSPKILIMVLQWLLFPFCMIAFGSLPATEAQTRLMLGKYLGFRVTEKFRR
ncbi:MAG: glycosyltransferase family 2 protein [Patescibacteria group bacterium]|nr:glycosyltransferase family 2 protein [Patescibacteria group bacterium]